VRINEASVLDELVDLVADARTLVEAEIHRGVSGFPKSPPGVETAMTEPKRAARPQRRAVEQPKPAVKPAVRVQTTPKQAPTAPAPIRKKPEPLYDIRQPGMGSAELVSIRRELGECTLCPLSAKRKQIVFGAGDPDADLVIVGEGPGAQEDLQGLPFVGAAGEMLSKMLENVIGLKRQDVYILNVVKCRPENNRKPRPEEVETCSPFLAQQIRAISPKIIVALGTTATRALLGASQGVTALRGGWAEWEGYAVMPTFHPAYLLRSPQDKRLVFQDLKLVRRRYDELGGKRA